MGLCVCLCVRCCVLYLCASVIRTFIGVAYTACVPALTSIFSVWSLAVFLSFALCPSLDVA